MSIANIANTASEWTVKERIDWLRADPIQSRDTYLALADLYRQAGHDREAKTIAEAGEYSTSSIARRILASSVGFGYRPGRAILIALALLIVSLVAINLAETAVNFAPANSDAAAECPRDFPCFDSLAYTIETITPLVDLGQREAWIIDARPKWGPTAIWIERILVFCGWFLSIMVGAAVTGLVQRD